MSKIRKCDVTKCQASCCYNVPLDKGYLTAFRKKIVNPVVNKEPIGGRNYLVFTNENPAKNKCPFLRADCRCNIYNDRPKICRDFGTTQGEKFLHCKFLQGEEGAPTLNDIEKATHFYYSNYMKDETD